MADLIYKIKYITQSQPDRFDVLPTCVVHRYGIDEAYLSLFICGDDPIADTCQRCVQPLSAFFQLLFQLMPGQRGFNRDQQLLIVEGSVDVAKWPRESRPLDCVLANAAC